MRVDSSLPAVSRVRVDSSLPAVSRLHIDTLGDATSRSHHVRRVLRAIQHVVYPATVVYTCAPEYICVRFLVLTEKGSVSVAAEFQHLFPAKISSTLSAWKRTTYEDFTVRTWADYLV